MAVSSFLLLLPHITVTKSSAREPDQEPPGPQHAGTELGRAEPRNLPTVAAKKGAARLETASWEGVTSEHEVWR